MRILIILWCRKWVPLQSKWNCICHYISAAALGTKHNFTFSIMPFRLVNSRGKKVSHSWLKVLAISLLHTPYWRPASRVPMKKGRTRLDKYKGDSMVTLRYELIIITCMHVKDEKSSPQSVLLVWVSKFSVSDCSLMDIKSRKFKRCSVACIPHNAESAGTTHYSLVCSPEHGHKQYNRFVPA